MIRFLIRRALHAATLLFIVLSATFLLIKMAPGDPLTRFQGPETDPRSLEHLRRQLGFDDPLPIQYGKMMLSFVRGDFGMSIAENRPVADILRDALPPTVLLMGVALLLQIVIGVGLGLVTTARRYGHVDRWASVLFLVLYSIPSFYLAFLLIAVFSLQLGWFPSAGMFSLHAGGAGWWAQVHDRLIHMILPVSVLALGSAAVLARYTRGSMLDVIGSEFIRTARAKGLAEGPVVWRHALRNAMPQILTVLGLSVPVLLAGAVVIEKVFAWPGMGLLLVDSIFARDYPVVLAANLVAALGVILGNFLADLSHAWADPRVRRTLDG